MSNLTEHFTDDRYLFRAGDEASIEFTRLTDGRDGGIRAEVEIRYHVKPHAGLLKHQQINLLAPRSIKTLANECSDMVSDLNWDGLLTAAVYRTTKRYREGEPPVRLSEVDPSIRPRYLLRNFVEFEGPTVIAGDGGTLKSMIAEAACLTVCTGRTGILGLKPLETGPAFYLDWEADKYAHQNRVAAMCASLGIPIPDNLYYRREYAPLHQSANELARYTADIGAVLVVIDSKGMAIGGDSEKADPTRQLYQAARKLNCATIVVDHVTNEGAKSGTDRPFGSAYNKNIARNVFMAKKESSEPGEVTVTWKQTKENNGPSGRRLSWRVNFEMDGDDRYRTIGIRPVSSKEVATLHVDGGNTMDLIREQLGKAKGPLTVKELSVLLDISQAQIRTRLNDGRRSNEFANVATSGVGKWTLGTDYLGTGSLPDPY